MNQSGQGGRLKDLILLASLFLLGILFLCNVVVSFVLGIPFQDPTEDETFGDETTDVPCDNENDYQYTTLCAVQFSPKKWGFLMHIFSYLSMAGALVFLIANVFRVSRDGKVYSSPAVFSLPTSICANLTLVFYLPWLFLWDQGQWTGSVILLFLATLTTWASLIIFSINLSQESAYLHHNSPLDLWIYRVLVQNVLAINSTWTTLLLVINFSLALVYDANLKDPLGSEIVIVILTFIIAIWTPLEIMICDKFFRYMISPFIVILWTLGSIYDRLKDDSCHDATVRVYTLVLIIILAVLLVPRILFTVYRHLRKPLDKTS